MPLSFGSGGFSWIGGFTSGSLAQVTAPNVEISVARLLGDAEHLTCTFAICRGDDWRVPGECGAPSQDTKELLRCGKLKLSVQNVRSASQCKGHENSIPSP